MNLTSDYSPQLWSVSERKVNKWNTIEIKYHNQNLFIVKKKKIEVCVEMKI